MSVDIDFKALWNRQDSSVPDMAEILEKAGQLNRKTRNNIWRQYILLSLTIIFLIWVWWYYQPTMVTTKIGIMLVIIAIVSYLTIAGQLLPLLFKVNLETDSRQYLNRLIQIKQKQEFLNKTILNAYFILLSSGIFLYMIEYVGRGSIVFQLTAYGITSLWIAFNWFYIRPKTINKQQKAINDVIGKLELLNGQLLKE
jgi:prepilin signal peptidase PulO-like enzyme (type II secretory pathway)